MKFFMNNGAGRENQTLLIGLETQGNNQYTIPAKVFKYGAECRIRTDSLRITSALHYRYANSACVYLVRKNLDNKNPL